MGKYFSILSHPRQNVWMLFAITLSRAKYHFFKLHSFSRNLKEEEEVGYYWIKPKCRNLQSRKIHKHQFFPRFLFFFRIHQNIINILIRNAYFSCIIRSDWELISSLDIQSLIKSFKSRVHPSSNADDNLLTTKQCLEKYLKEGCSSC